MLPQCIAVCWVSTLILCSYEIYIDWRVSSLLEMSMSRKSLKGIHSSRSRLKLSSNILLCGFTVKVFSSIVTPPKRPSASIYFFPEGELYSQVMCFVESPQLSLNWGVFFEVRSPSCAHTSWVDVFNTYLEGERVQFPLGVLI